LSGRSNNHLDKGSFRLRASIASTNADSFLDTIMDELGFGADRLVVPELVNLPFMGLDAEELARERFEFVIGNLVELAWINR
jgi:hypothetical protein